MFNQTCSIQSPGLALSCPAERRSMQSSTLALGFFAFCNGLRVLAYVPQIVRVAKDEQGASAVSCATWAMFMLANVSTVIYAVVVANDVSLASIFSANAAGCSLICGLTIHR